MVKKITYSLFLFLIFSCIQTPANLRMSKANSFLESRSNQPSSRFNAQELFYISLKYLANDLGSEIIHSSRTKLRERKITKRLHSINSIETKT